jgi:hypothetical protein
MSFITVSGHVTDYTLSVSGTTNWEGSWAAGELITEDTFERLGQIDSKGDQVGTGVEHGTLLGLDLSNFVIANAVAIPNELVMGQDAAGVSCTREVHYDDCLCVIGVSGEVVLPSGPVHIYPVPVTGQGTHDDFTPSAGWDRVNEVPCAAGGTTIASSTADAKTLYAHSPLTSTTEAIRGVKVTANAAAVASAVDAFLFDEEEVTYSFNTTTDDTDSNSARGYKWYTDPPATAAEFNALQYGLTNKIGGSTLTVKNLCMEALAVYGTNYLPVPPSDGGPTSGPGSDSGVGPAPTPPGSPSPDFPGLDVEAFCIGCEAPNTDIADTAVAAGCILPDP